MSHHFSGPNVGFPRGDARLDLTDVYAFPKPGDPGKSILIMNFHPSVGINPPGPTTDELSAPGALYELKIDTDGDLVADIAYQVCFSSSQDGTQTATLRRVEGAQAAGTGEGGQISSRERQCRWDGRHGLLRPAITASLWAGEAMPSSSM